MQFKGPQKEVKNEFIEEVNDDELVLDSEDEARNKKKSGMA